MAGDLYVKYGQKGIDKVEVVACSVKLENDCMVKFNSRRRTSYPRTPDMWLTLLDYAHSLRQTRPIGSLDTLPAMGDTRPAE